MNKKKCPQCKNLISISAPTCLYCGRPNKFVTKDYINKKWNNNNKSLKYINKILISKYTLFILAFLIVVLIAFN